MNPLKTLVNDKTSGSLELTLKLNNILKKTKDTKEIVIILNEVEKNLKGFSAVDNYISKVNEYLSTKSVSSLQTFFNEFELEIKNTITVIFEKAKLNIGQYETFFTLSNSFTLFEVLKKLNAIKKIEVFICESEPACEGVILAEKLKSFKINLKVIKDSEMSVYIPNSDVILLGADKILNNGDIINKSGSYSAALIASTFNKPVYVIGNKSKFYKKDDKNNLFKSNLFEVVPAKLITKIITD
ncbi:MAG: hypothetical protein COW08_03410 [Ignavibacteriales bacterium CG12_big_fil_rev_8_21_14_0_65_30_8]|nr:MAG: hypothetical protein COW08_03410 [Ignavibacteriales bacterium CG12_big_fil_rev_8_21_14_0_65_30_8]